MVWKSLWETRQSPRVRNSGHDIWKYVREHMDKYAVDTGAGDQEKLEKQAAAGCPECGQKLEKQGKVLACPTHGTEPFEKGAR